MDSKLDLFNYRVAKTVLGNRRMESDWLMGWYFAQKLLKIFPDSVEIKDEASLAAFYSKEYDRSAEIINDLLDLKPPRHMIARVMGNKRFCAPHLLKKALLASQAQQIASPDEGYGSDASDKEGHLDHSPYIFVCRGTSAATVRNFLEHCSDAYLFSHFYYLYDNDEEMVKMDHGPEVSSNRPLVAQELPQYFEFVKYDSSLLNSLGDKCSPYIFNMEGDWLFFDRRNYVTILRDIIDSAGNGASYGQVLMNQNYSCSVDDWSQEGSEKYTGLERRYYEDSASFDGSSPALLNREVLYEYDFEANYKNTHKTALMDGVHVVRG
jgi:hypothetical protein